MTTSVKARHRKAARPLTPLTSAPRMARRGLAVAASSGLALTMIASGASAANQSTESANASAGTLKAGLTAQAAKAATQNASITVAADAKAAADVTAASGVAKTEDTAKIEAEKKAAEEKAAEEAAAAKAAEEAAAAAAAAAATTTTTSTGSTASTSAATTTAAASSSAIVATAMQYVGSAYVYGAAGPSAFDCSGLVSYVYAQYGISLPHQSEAIKNSGTVISASAAQPGDVIWWSGHVAIYAGNGMMVSADNPSAGVTYRAVDAGGTYVRIG
ncbi:C40 family peptidase [Actinomyces radicidentis]|uniref:C40 family peptidase n=1 Tax=Actinomyces radicidentis TaxID=111015 RepID=UPI0028E7BEB1|nr:C40 family peptidase [Actinomyces radicidentis]